MNIQLIGHDYRYAAEQMLLMLFPEERPVYGQAGGGNEVNITLYRGARFCTASCRLSCDGRAARGSARFGLASLDRGADAARLEQRIVKLAFYRAALALGVPKPVWGCLTGVRPAKYMAGLVHKDGLSPAAAKRALVRDCGVEPERAELCAASFAAAERVRAALAPEDVCLYVGIPYCPTRCGYCSFVSVDAPKLLKTIPAYLDALEKEMDALAGAVAQSGRRIVAVYVGGGTPTTLSAEELDRLLGALRDKFDLSACREFTVEAGRPDTVTPEKLSVLVRQGVDRVSVNPQTMCDEILRTIGRHHTAAEIVEAVGMARRAGPLAVNMDLIAGLPGDGPGIFADTLDAVLALGPENVTVHTLALKKGSRFLTDRDCVLPDGAAVGEMLSLAAEKLTGAGFAPYYIYRQKFMSGSFENVGWTRPGHENLYNICIMEELCPILALGAGGSTKLTAPGGIVKRLMAPKYPREYLDRIEDTCRAKDGIVRFFAADGKGE